MFKTAKEITLIALYVALLLGGQYALSGLPNVEVVTVLVVCFGFCFGIIRGIIVVSLFSVLRCFIFGFFPTVIILYLVYFNLLAIVFAVLGYVFNKKINWWKMIVIVVLSCALTVCFTLIDDVITPLFFGFSKRATKMYFYASLPFMTTQVISALISVSVLFYPLVKAFSYISFLNIPRPPSKENQQHNVDNILWENDDNAQL